MKKIIALILCVGWLGLTILAQTDKTRPRIVGTGNAPSNPNTSAPPNPVPTPGTDKQPPVLRGDNKPTAINNETVVDDDNDVIKIETELVTIPVTVLDRNGHFIPGLRKQDFQIFEDGTQQQIEYFASLETPFTVVLLIDASMSTQFKIEEIQNAAMSFINQLRPDDPVTVVSFDEKIHVLAQVTTNRAVLKNAVQQLQFGGGTSLYEAVDHTISQELRSIKGRKAVVLFTDGVDTTSKRATYQSTVKEAEELDAMIYPIRYDTLLDMQRAGSGGNISVVSNGSAGGNKKEDYEKGIMYLQDLARVSGGRNFEALSTSNLDKAFSSIAEELRWQYSIGYYPDKEGKAGQRKQIKVRLARNNAIVQAKNSYIVSKKARPNTATKQVTKPVGKSRLPF
jgi:Ca-activated chloride channel family protein